MAKGQVRSVDENDIHRTFLNNPRRKSGTSFTTFTAASTGGRSWMRRLSLGNRMGPLRRWAYDPYAPASRVGQHTGGDRGNLETQARNLPELGSRDKFIYQDVASGRSMPETRRVLHKLSLKRS